MEELIKELIETISRVDWGLVAVGFFSLAAILLFIYGFLTPD